jgi:hypothetical protein
MHSLGAITVAWRVNWENWLSRLQTKKKKTENWCNSFIRRADIIAKPIVINVGVEGVLPNIISLAKFGDCRFEL